MDCADPSLDASSKAESQRGDRHGSNVGILLSRHGAILDYQRASDDMDGRTLVDEFLDCDIDLGANYGLGSSIIWLVGGWDVIAHTTTKCNQPRNYGMCDV